MGKVLEFRRVKQEAKMLQEMLQQAAVDPDDFEQDIIAIMNDYSLTPANRRYLLENMLMDIDDQLETYKKELEKAEKKLETVVAAAEKEIETAYREFDRHVSGMTSQVKKLTKARRHQPRFDDGSEQQANPTK